MKDKDKSYLNIKKKYLNFLKKQVVVGEPFHDKIGQLKKFYIPISNSINFKFFRNKKTTIIGLSGGQGSGKTTITKILKIILETKFNLKVLSFSIDDFYKTRSQRKKMSKNVHKLFLTRGVPGTHDTALLKKCFHYLLRKKFKIFEIPTFDKSKDDRHPKKSWVKVKKRPDIVIFEGWCVGASKQSYSKLKNPINLLEKNYDKKLTWRKKVNNELNNNYNKIFKKIDKLIFLQVPNFSYVYKWRLLQETKLLSKSKGNKTMTKLQIKKFVMYYERITKQMISDLKIKSDILIKLDKKHRLSSIKLS